VHVFLGISDEIVDFLNVKLRFQTGIKEISVNDRNNHIFKVSDFSYFQEN